ncbi:MAG: hypothetical protein V1856_00925 [Candidatus Liptonbacteria bacterium]
MNNRLIIGGVALIAVAAVAAVVSWFIITPKTPIGEVCTQDAKLCSDGSYVSRTGPNCEFAQCPVPAENGIAIGANATVNGTTIGVLELVEDSRCPADVQCIQAGTVRVRASIDSYNRDFTFTLLEPQSVGNVNITLASVAPAQKYSTQTVQPSEYRFTFTVEPKAAPPAPPVPGGGGILPYNSGIRGTVLLGPTCPVMRDPPDPGCADKPYETTILVYRFGAGSVIATVKSGTNGEFEVSLPPGKYTLAASGGAVLPRCSSVDAVVGQTGYVTANISCDTGIR